MSISIFISHSSTDIELARGLSALFQKAFRFPADKILCSSVAVIGLRAVTGQRRFFDESFSRLRFLLV
jgi:hypothetical protein